MSLKDVGKLRQSLWKCIYDFQCIYIDTPALMNELIRTLLCIRLLGNITLTYDVVKYTETRQHIS